MPIYWSLYCAIFKIVNTWYDQIITLLLLSFYFVYKIEQYYNFLQEKLFKKKKFVDTSMVGVRDLNIECLYWKYHEVPISWITRLLAKNIEILEETNNTSNGIKTNTTVQLH